MELDRLRPADNATRRTSFWVIIGIAIPQTGIRYPIFNPGFDICVHLRSKPLLMMSLPPGEACLAQVMSHFCVPKKTRHRDKTRQNATNRDISPPPSATPLPRRSLGEGGPSSTLHMARAALTSAKRPVRLALRVLCGYRFRPFVALRVGC